MVDKGNSTGQCPTYTREHEVAALVLAHDLHEMFGWEFVEWGYVH